MFTHLSLFSGIGGLDLAAEAAGFKTVAQVEIDAFANTVLEKNFPEVARWKDVREFTGNDFYKRTGLQTVNVLSGGGSPASLTALRESVSRLVTAVTYGEKCGGSFAKLDRNGSWVKMYSGCYQVRMDDSLEEYSGTFPRWGIMFHGECFQPPRLEPYINASGWRLLPTPTANLWMGYDAGTAITAIGEKHITRTTGKKYGIILNNCPVFLPWYQKGTQNLLNPLLLEKMMGFPMRWTEIKR